jgi:hypothetical protein
MQQRSLDEQTVVVLAIAAETAVPGRADTL